MPADANRMVVQNGDLDEVVHDVSTAQNEAMDYVKALGGICKRAPLARLRKTFRRPTLGLEFPEGFHPRNEPLQVAGHRQHPHQVRSRDGGRRDGSIR